MSKELLKANIDQMLKSVYLCFENNLITSCLILIYSAIDCMSALHRPVDQQKVQKQDFLDWSSKYIIPYLNFDCTPLDLYSARCGIIHTYTPDSALTRNNKAKTVYYACGPAKVKDLRKSIKLTHEDKNITAIQIEVLIEALKKGIQDFESDIRECGFENIVFERASNFFVKMSMKEIDEIKPIINKKIKD
ncbi:MAG: hypothetical protein U5O15_08040 [Candidatus Krumholzibacteriota bacterium]|nr:hypothetical protein [Candidatus Krumholzibacteriota bacterium]